eukprot:COSAG04_NODE_7973_length_1039_cov_1.519149_2_plen_80_part_01
MISATSVLLAASCRAERKMPLRLRVLLAVAALAGRAQALSPVASCASLAAVRFSGEEAANISVISATRNDTAGECRQRRA